MKIGLLGGSFNPPHQGHLYIGKIAKKKFKLKQIWLIPTKQNPLKSKINSSFKQRVKLCQDLIKTTPDFLVKDEEKNLKSNYTIDLIERIIKKYPHHQFYWIMGADSLINFHLWKNWQKIIRKTPIIIINRNSDFFNAKKSRAWNFANKIGIGNNHFLNVKKINISSTQIRNKHGKI